MRLESTDGAVVHLRPVAYESDDVSSLDGDHWDANWLTVEGAITLADGRSWSFREPCLTTWEARELAAWLTSVVAGEARLTDGDAERPGGRLQFTEPCLGFSLAARADDGVVLRVHLSLEALPYDADPPVQDGTDEYVVVLQTTSAGVAMAAEQWWREVLAFPPV